MNMIRYAAVAALSLAASATFAQSETRIATSTFDLTTVPMVSWTYPGVREVVLSDENGVTRLDMVSLDALRLWQHWPSPYSSSDGDHYLMTFDLQLRAGHRLTGIELSGSMFGDLHLAPVDPFFFDTPGSVGNTAFVDVSIGASAPPNDWGTVTSIGSTRLTDFDGIQSFLAGTRGLDLQGGFRLRIEGSAVARVVSPTRNGNCYTYEYSCANAYPAHASSVGVRDSVLTIYTQPVPEPSTYVLLMAGLFTLGAVARRRQQA